MVSLTMKECWYITLQRDKKGRSFKKGDDCVKNERIYHVERKEQKISHILSSPLPGGEHALISGNPTTIVAIALSL